MGEENSQKPEQHVYRAYNSTSQEGEKLDKATVAKKSFIVIFDSDLSYPCLIFNIYVNDDYTFSFRFYQLSHTLRNCLCY